MEGGLAYLVVAPGAEVCPVSDQSRFNAHDLQAHHDEHHHTMTFAACSKCHKTWIRVEWDEDGRPHTGWIDTYTYRAWRKWMAREAGDENWEKM